MCGEHKDGAGAADSPPRCCSAHLGSRRTAVPADRLRSARCPHTRRRRRRPAAPRVKAHRAFDPRQVGRLETAAWVAYYRREWLSVPARRRRAHPPHLRPAVALDAVRGLARAARQPAVGAVPGQRPRGRPPGHGALLPAGRDAPRRVARPPPGVGARGRVVAGAPGAPARGEPGGRELARRCAHRALLLRLRRLPRPR